MATSPKIALPPTGAFDGSIGTNAEFGPRGTPEWIARGLRELIHRGVLNAGDRFPPEREMCEQIGVARLTLRAGLKILREEGYIMSRRGSGGGTYVTELGIPYKRWVKKIRENPKWLGDLTELRVAVESHTARLAAVRRDADDLEALEKAIRPLEDSISFNDFRAADAAFHSRLGAASGNASLATAVEDARSQTFVPGNAELVQPVAIAKTHEEHTLVYEAVREKDSEKAAAAMERHLRSTHDYVLEALKLADR